MLRQLIEDDLYVVDERLVAEAILLRAHARSLLPELTFRGERVASIRSFRLEQEARSFRLGGRARTRQLHH